MRPTTTALLVLLAAGSRTAAAQEWRRLIDDLGDPERTAAAEAALLGLGSNATPALEEVLEDWDTADARHCDRLVAALRVVDLLGESASALHGTLAKIVTSRRSNELRGPDERLLLPELLQAIGSTSPYESEVAFHDLFHHSMVASAGDEKAAVFRAIFRYRERHKHPVSSIEEARSVIADDRIFAREVAAERMLRTGTLTDAVLLRDRLLDRATPPDGFDELTHNGFVIPIDDDFALRAARALVRIAPDDAVSAIGHAILARDHPHRDSRLAALRGLARFGPDAAPAIPELVAVATGPDPELAAEALKIIGMGGKAGGDHLATIDGLRQHADPGVARRARSLAKMLRAMGCEPRPPDPDAAAQAAHRRALRVAVGALADPATKAVEAAELVIAEDADTALELLVERFRRERDDCPDRVVEWIGRLGRTRGHEERDRLRYSLATTGDRWSGPSFSSSTGGQAMSDARMRAYGTLTVGSPENVNEVGMYFHAQNQAVTLAAARELAGRTEEIAAAAAAEARAELWRAVSGDHPEKSTFERGRGNKSTRALDLEDEIRTEAAGALLPAEQPSDRHAVLLRHAVRHPSAAVAARALATWGEHADVEDLERAAADPRAAVAAAAEAALARRKARR